MASRGQSFWKSLLYGSQLNNILIYFNLEIPRPSNLSQMNIGLEKFVPLRTALFVPGDRPERVDKAVIIDLENAVSRAKKKETRGVVREKLLGFRGRERDIIVRVNAMESGFLEGDLQEVVVENLACILVPKVEGADQVRKINSLLLEVEKEKGMGAGSITLMLLIESAKGVQDVYEIISERTEPNRLFTVAFGAADYCLDLGIDITRDGRELDYPRSRIPVACRAAAIAPPLDTPFMVDLKDLEALRADAMRARRLGFQGKLYIHPNQIEICNEVFSPTEEETLFAEKVVRAFEEAEAQGMAVIQFEGKLIDPPVVERSKRILILAAAIRGK